MCPGISDYSDGSGFRILFTIRAKLERVTPQKRDVP
jgi:hypothetical protein